MAYYDLLTKSPYRDRLPEQLLQHIDGERLADAGVDYILPDIDVDPTGPNKKEVYETKPTDVRIPARLDSPLIPYPLEIRQLIAGTYPGSTDNFHAHHTSQLSALARQFDRLRTDGVIPHGPFKFDMDSLKRFGRQSYSHREDVINLATLAFAKRATQHDLSIAAMKQVEFHVSAPKTSQYTSFIIMIQRLRMHIAKNVEAHKYTADLFRTETDEASFHMMSEGVYIYKSTRTNHKFYLLSCGGHFRMYHESLGYWFCGPQSYLDYVFSLADILNNLDVLKNCDEYVWARPFLKVMIQFAEHEGHHNEQVDFMKSMEGFLLNMSDYDEEFAMNWKPMLEAAYELWKLDQSISGVSYDFGLILCLLRGKDYACPAKSYFCKMINEGKRLSRTHLQEVSALHKLIFYSEVNAEKGVMKFLKRVHTKRPMDVDAVKNITRFAKMHFLIAYRKRHKSLPNLIAPVQKKKLLEAYSQRSDFQHIESLTLSWWDDVQLYDCMDNTLTDDPLEFAKDKGALKSMISFGPGDSRKELLQVLERDKYELKDFFKERSFKPHAQKVIKTCQKATPEKIKDPARLIEKEREQKWEARLYANAELENKHSLSLVAAKMKKALSYFDEQLMTPTDRKRKALIHEASRELSQPDNYSLLLDIEGHNQSMQYENTSELCEFVGMLFGQTGWGQLGGYFSQLTVYHYDEYLDQVIESHGQYGGIEGWLNPLWTLHTLIMMKLLRIMTDVAVQTIMVYSDDVNAIVKIRQASEPMVKSVFAKIMTHCSKFGMTVKYSQTTLSKHRITMLRQHYADGVRADSTLKRLLSVSAGNNPVIVAEELEVSGISSSASSAMELSNHHEACAYLKNYKLGLLLCRLPQMILSKPTEFSMISSEELPPKLSNLLYYTKDDKSALNLTSDKGLMAAAKNDIAAYLGRHPNQLSEGVFQRALKSIYGVGIAESRFVDNPDRVMYLQIYDDFMMDLLFFWTYLPTNLGGLGAALHLNLMLSGHSIGFSKSIHYLFQWISRCSSQPDYFYRYLTTVLSVDMSHEVNVDETRLVTEPWPCDKRICPVTTSVQQAIKSMVRHKTRNVKIRELFELADDRNGLACELLEIFRTNFHSRIVQFYHENTSIHFVDLLLSKIETSSGLLSRVRNITKLRNSLSFRMIENIRTGATLGRTVYFAVGENIDIIYELSKRKSAMFPSVSFIEVEEILYDDKLEEVEQIQALVTVRRCSPMHYRNGIRVYDDPKTGNEVLYKGELMDDDKMLGNKEELLAAKLVAVTKWFLIKGGFLSLSAVERASLDISKACNLSLSTLTQQTFEDLFHFAPTETGGEILHRIPNIRFSTATYIRAEMNRSLCYTTDLGQRMITGMGLVDSNVNFDYLRMRLLVAAIVCDKYDNLRRLVTRYNFRHICGIVDVQFVTPKVSNHVVKKKFSCYASLRGHILSPLRFRYLARSYLYEENVNEWALIPNLPEQQTADQLGASYINDIILRYAKDLDRDYMLIHPRVLDRNIWLPLVTKLDKIDPVWRRDHSIPVMEEISNRLKSVMHDRARITVLDKTDRVVLELQSSCLTALYETMPSDTEFQLLVQRYVSLSQSRRHSRNLSLRLAQYQSMLTEYNTHRVALAKALLKEYLLTFHFKIHRLGSELSYDVQESLREFRENGLGSLSLMPVAPELQTRLLVLGMDFVEMVVLSRMNEVSAELTDLCDELSLIDIIMPVGLPSMGTHTTLTGAEPAPNHLGEIGYIMTEISHSAMSTLEQILPLCRYAHKCSTGGARPETFTSYTGSDSLLSQYGLFKLLMSEGILDKGMKICDLTAGRGDGQYALSYLGLHGQSYSREDTFTRIFHHPAVQFLQEYDIFNGSTIKFVCEYDFVHVDISFSGKTDGDLLDLVLFLEESNLAYSVRLNSVPCTGYLRERVSHLPTYKHYISYAANKHLKPYQIYLVGVPSMQVPDWDSGPLRQTIAFKSLALSFSQLLSPETQKFKLATYDWNSASIYLPEGSQLDKFLTSIARESLTEEQLYYCTRYTTEIGEGGTIQVCPTMLEGGGQDLVARHLSFMDQGMTPLYTDTGTDLIGSVSKAARPYHERHLKSLLASDLIKVHINPLKCDEEFLTYFRSKHPIQEVRTWCNIALGVLEFCPELCRSGYSAVNEFVEDNRGQSSPKLSLHQKEIRLAMKLHLLSASKDDHSYGSQYCHLLSAKGGRSNASIDRTLRMYRLTSFLYDRSKVLVNGGGITIRDIRSMSSAVEVREVKRYKYKRTIGPVKDPTDDPLFLDHIISDSIDNLFVGLQNYATGLVEATTEINPELNMDSVLSQANMTFDIGIEEQVNLMIKRLNLKPSGPHGIIDLGDEDMPDYEDW